MLSAQTRGKADQAPLLRNELGISRLVLSNCFSFASLGFFWGSLISVIFLFIAIIIVLF